MTDDSPGRGETASGVVRQPLPPEVPAPRPAAEPAPELEPDPESAQEWWRRPAAADEPGARTEAGAGPDAPDAADPETDEAPDGHRFWNGPAVRAELHQAWTDHGIEAVAAAHEVGAQIGGAIAEHLGPPAAARRGLDIRWMRLKYNVPALVLAGLTTWRGVSPAEGMIHYVATRGVFAPVGWLLMAVLVLGALMLTPLGSALGSAVAHLVATLIAAAVRSAGRAWSLPVIGYVLKVLAATAAWSFAIAVAYLVGRSAIRFLTGV